MSTLSEDSEVDLLLMDFAMDDQVFAVEHTLLVVF